MVPNLINLNVMKEIVRHVGQRTLKYIECLIFADEGKGTYNWTRWQFGHIADSSSGKDIKRQILAQRSVTLKELIDEFVNEVDFLANHLFIA